MKGIKQLILKLKTEVKSNEYDLDKLNSRICTARYADKLQIQVAMDRLLDENKIKLQLINELFDILAAREGEN